MPLRRFSPETQVPPVNYTVLDLETTGLDACTCEILELGAIRYRGHKQVEKFHTFIRPEGVIPSRASEINHITWPKVAGAPSLFDIGDAFFNFIGDDTLVGFNIGFDIKFIQTRFGVDIKNVSFDVLPFAKECYPGLFSYKLDELRRYFSLGGTAHSALGDCVATANLLALCLSTEDGKFLAKQAVVNQARSEIEQARLEAEQELYQKQREEAKARKTAERMGGPTQSELRTRSKNMVGNNSSYIHELYNILQKSGRSIAPLDNDGYSDRYQAIRLNGSLIMGVKTTGNLKYVVLDLPPSSFGSELICAPSSLIEGSTATRIFISSPNDLTHVKPQILSTYDAALACYESQENERKASQEQLKQALEQEAKLFVGSLSMEERERLRDILHNKQTALQDDK